MRYEKWKICWFVCRPSIPSGHRLLSSDYQLSEPGIGSQRFQSGIDAHEGKSDGMLAFSLREPAKRIVGFPNRRINNCDFVSRNPLLRTPFQNLLQNSAG